ncbi:hypothetical protein DFH28DRAFT_930226 [Melampsora americana]|nr:hypothetical protein DFH28DRAFT_930226 [Melampsora americana]
MMVPRLKWRCTSIMARVDTRSKPNLLPLVLYVKVITAILANPTKWKNQVLPPGYENDVLLTHIDLPHQVQTGCHVNVPMLDTVIVRLYQKEGGLITGWVQRIQAISWGLNPAEYEVWSLWNVVDCQLECLNTQTRRYRYGFFILALQFDVEHIDGTKNSKQLEQTMDFSPPIQVQIQATMAILDETFGQEVPPDEEAYDFGD